MMKEKDFFVLDCIELNGKISRLLDDKYSDRVRCSCFLTALGEIIIQQDKPEASLEQVINTLRNMVSQE